MLGARFGNTCYSTYNEAAAAYFNSTAPTTIASGDTVSFQFVWGLWSRNTASPSGLNTSTPAYLPSFESCDTLQGFNDGLILGSALAAVLVIASLYGIIARAR
jgi:hypothetical protein